jgi:hypothetical protein
MPLAWIDPPNTVRDVAPGDPTLLYHPDIAKFYDTEVPDGTINGATKKGKKWTNPQPAPEPPPRPPEPPAPPPVPESVTPLQARKALRKAGLLNTVNDFISTQSDEVQEAWEYCISVYRNDPLITSLQVELNLTNEQLDDLFRSAAEIV